MMLTSHMESNGELDIERTTDGLAKRRNTFHKRVSFPSNESELVQNLEPSFPEGESVLMNVDLAQIYGSSCRKNGTKLVDRIVHQLKEADLMSPRSSDLSLRGIQLEPGDCESLEEVLKIASFRMFDLGDTHTADEGLIALFDMVEFYEAATHVRITGNKCMSSRSWQSCCRMIKRAECLEWLDAAEIPINEHSSTYLSRALRSNSPLKILFLNGCCLAGRPLSNIACSLKLNRHLRELHLAENQLTSFDALQLGILLSGNTSLQVIDLRNNDIQDKGMQYLCDGLMDNLALQSLIVWNNGITSQSAPSIGKLMGTNRILKTLNLGHNRFQDEGVLQLISFGFVENRSLTCLGLQNNGITCPGIIGLAGMLSSTRLERLDLRKNPFELDGLMALESTVKTCNLTRLDLDLEEYQELCDGINSYCEANRKEEVMSRKISLTCPIPSERVVSDEKSPKRLRSPSPSPSPSPCPRFQVTPVSSESRFQVTPVSSDHFIKSSPTKVIVGFDIS